MNNFKDIPGYEGLYKISIDDTIYYSVREAARQLNIHHSGILKVLNGEYNQTGGYHFKYAIKGGNDNECK